MGMPGFSASASASSAAQGGTAGLGDSTQSISIGGGLFGGFGRSWETFSRKQPLAALVAMLAAFALAAYVLVQIFGGKGGKKRRRR